MQVPIWKKKKKKKVFSITIMITIFCKNDCNLLKMITIN